MNTPSDLQFPVLITLEEATQGAHRDFLYSRRHLLCAACEGSGRLEEGRCDGCKGAGGTFLPRKVTVTIPPGVDSQTRIRLRGHGLLNADADEWGDLYLVCYHRRHARLKRSDYDVTVRVPATAIRNGQLQVSGPAGLLTLDCPGGGPGMLRVPGQGLFRRIGGQERGDLLVEIVPAPGEEAERRFPELKAEARAHLEEGQFAVVVTKLGWPELEPLWDAEAHALLGLAYTQSGDARAGLRHLGLAADQERENPNHRLHMALAAYRSGRCFLACLHLEAALQRERTPARIRPTLARVLEQLFAEAGKELAKTYPGLQSGLAPVGKLAVERSYTQAESLLCDLEELVRGADSGGLRRLRALTLLLASLSGSEESVPVAEQLLNELASDPDQAAFAGEARELAREFLERDCRLPGLLVLTAAAVSAGNWPRASYAAGRAARAVVSYAPRIVQMPSDPLAVWEDELIRAQIHGLFAGLDLRAKDPAAAAVRGLVHLVEAHYMMRLQGDVKSGWPAVVQAVKHLEIALCLTPDDPAVQEPFEAAVDLLTAIATAVQGEEPAEESEFFQNTCDAAVARLIPGAPFNDLVSPTHVSPLLKALTHEAFGSLFTGARRPLSGEFLVGAAEGYFALTNYRLHLPNDELYGPQILPLNVINRFSVRTAGLNISTLIIGLSNGRQHALNNIPNGTFPPEQVMNYLIAARMWERLGANDQETLAAGRASRPAPVAAPALPGTTSPAAPALAPGSVTAAPALGAGPGNGNCPQCDNPPKPGDVFCRRCGTRLTGSTGALTPILPLDG